MKKLFRASHRQLFFLILAIIFFMHGSALFYTFKFTSPSKKASSSRPDVVRVQVKKSTQLFSNQFKQIVQSEDPDEFKKPDRSRFLSDKDRTFHRETMARKVDKFQKSSRGSVGITFDGKEIEASPKKVPSKTLALSDLGHPVDRHPLLMAAKKYAKSGHKQVPNQGSTVSSTNDYVEDVPLGDLTQLNTQEYKYYGFYHRIRSKLEQFWGRSIQEKAEIIHKAGRTIAEDSNVITALRVTLDEMGEIIAIAVIGASGIRELDDAAIEAFNQAGPFPNPPKGMIVEGKVILEWGFVVNS